MSPLGPPQQYIIKYNGEQLPGYAQSEDDPNSMTVADHNAFGWDGSITQYAGLTNKQLKLVFRVWEPTYRACKDQYHKAATILRTRREGFAPLFVDYTDRYFNAAVVAVSYTQDVSKSRRILDYDVEFDCQPWQISTSGYVIHGAGNLDTDAVGRTYDDGGWSPAYTVITGTNVTISGYSDTESFTGFVSVSGHVANFAIDTAHGTSFLANGDTIITASGTGDKFMKWKDYGVWVAPGHSYWTVTGASSIYISYNNRWY